MKVAFIGLGTRGYPMAGHLKAKGHDVTVYNRTGARAEKWVGQFGRDQFYAEIQNMPGRAGTRRVSSRGSAPIERLHERCCVANLQIYRRSRAIDRIMDRCLDRLRHAMSGKPRSRQATGRNRRLGSRGSGGAV
ncbi:MAG: NAD(P)-binding domain-containing protein, partial [Methylovirgula sp.]